MLLLVVELTGKSKKVCKDERKKF